MKYKLLPILLLFSIKITFAQQPWSGTTTTDLSSRTGSVGIGITANPNIKLSVKGEIHVNNTWPYLQFNSSHWNSYSFIQNAVTLAAQGGGDYMVLYNPAGKGFNFRQGNYDAVTILPNGNVGIGITNSPYKLSVQGEIHVNRDYPYVQLNSSYWGAESFIQNGVTLAAQQGGNYTVIYNPGSKGFNFRQGAYDAMTILPNGNVGIGTTTSDARLAVKGQIHAQEVKVDLRGAVAPDYVFENDYKLLKLEEVESYIKANKHLPEIPSAKEIEEDGLELGKMEFQLLKKIEELTLYMIEFKKEMETLKEENTNLKKEVSTLKADKN